MENKSKRNEILSGLDNPSVLEKLYREDKGAFKEALNSLYPEHKENTLIHFWYERLNYSKHEISWGSGKEIFMLIIACITAGILAKIPELFNIDEEFFYPRNIGFIVFPLLGAYFIWKNKMQKRHIYVAVGLTLLGLVYINFLPAMKNSDTITLSCFHLLLFLWSILGFTFVSDYKNAYEKRLGFLKYNGDLLVMSALITIAGGIMSGITIGLFSLIGFEIEQFYFQYIIIFALPSIPLIGTYLTQNNPNLVGKVSPVIAKIFSPLVLVMLVIYLVAMVYSGKDPYNDREFLLIFNVLMVGVMAIIFFSIAGSNKQDKNETQTWILLLLTVVTIVVSGIALSAILFRISEWGMTANRCAVLGSNILILANLLLITAQLFKVLSKKSELFSVGKIIASYLPVYFIWTAIVTFLFPLFFGF